MSNSPIKVLNYHKSIHRLYWIVFSSLIFAELVILRLNVYEIMKVSFFDALVKIVLLSTVVLSIFFRLVVYVRPRVFSRYELYKDKVIIKFKRKSKEILFDHIQELKFSMLPPRFFGGFSVVMNTGQKFMFLSILNGSQEVLDHMLKKRPQLVKDEKVKSYVERTQCIEYSWERMKSKIKNWQLILVKYLAVPIVVTSVIKGFTEPLFHTQSGSTYWLVIFCVVIFLVLIGALTGNIIEEHFVLKKYLSSSKDAKAIEPYAKKAEILVQAGYYTDLLIITGLIVYFL